MHTCMYQGVYRRSAVTLSRGCQLESEGDANFRPIIDNVLF